jgi:heptosyltransferase I
MKLCLIRLSSVGDVTHALSVVRQIQARMPHAEITWVIGRPEHRLMRGLEGVELIEFNKAAGLHAYRDLRRTMRGRRFDVLLHLQVSFRANVAVTLLRADRRIGYYRERSRDLHGLFIGERIAAASEQHVLDTMMSFIVPIGLQPGTPSWDIPLAAEDHEVADTHVDPERSTLCISAVSSHPLRNWQIDGYARVADHAANRHGMQVILTGGPGEFERSFNAEIAARMNTSVLNLTGKDTLKQLAALLGRCDLLLAPDTGPMHIANAMGTDVLGLHAASNPRRSGPYHSLKWCINKYDAAARKYLKRGADEIRWGTKIEYPGVMDLISTNEVIDKLDMWVAERL